MIVNLIKRVIASGSFDKDDLKGKLDVYLLYSRITQAQYEELIQLIDGGSAEKNEF